MPSTSDKQRKFFILVYLTKTGRIKNPPKYIKEKADQLTLDQIIDILYFPSREEEHIKSKYKIINNYYST